LNPKVIAKIVLVSRKNFTGYILNGRRRRKQFKVDYDSIPIFTASIENL